MSVKSKGNKGFSKTAWVLRIFFSDAVFAEAAEEELFFAGGDLPDLGISL